MIVNERIVAYINSLDIGNSDVCNEIEKQAIADRVPIIRKEMGNLLKVLIALKQPSRILEIGAAVGYSSILMSENMSDNCTITTIENYEKRIPIAKANFNKAGKEDVITLLEGDAIEVMSGLEPGFDFIFMDAAKGQYINFLPEVMRLLAPGGLLISDNVLQEGDIVESRYGVTRRNRTIHTRMREYLYTITHMDELITSVVPIGDGITLSVKKSNVALKIKKGGK
ncbi:O-methyltransferase [[Clostridium] fimetarium]|uniref:tRNA 5-hydroxyuridine methyltransferase n=1 Tax=[Clostridium] fimetarium TaxID=99656 RepID=A0A1I0MZI2_9FIRM|nr:O-methyltransferase [[Clostridium] fimetarium]SEV94236.1 Predicted O-methyltransferase YrrM [[Clostridium] fimetarium]